jgi:NADPH:quinone reductase-like Zn-dependent oxidoreductase
VKCRGRWNGSPVYARPDQDRIDAFVQFVAMNEDAVAQKPRTLTMEEAASILLVLAAWQAPNAGVRINLDLFNAFQSKGLEEGNPRLASAGTNIFLARPLLPRRLQASIEYDFGDGGSRR